MENLVKIFNTKDLRYLLDEKVLPEKIDEAELLPVIDSIMLEYEKLINDRFYSNHLDDQDYILNKRATIVALTAYQELMLLNYIEEANIINDTWKLKAKSYEDADRKVSKLITDLKVMALKSLCPDCGGENPDCETCNGTGKVKEKPLSWGAMCANVNIHLKISARGATVAEYAEYQNIIKRMSEEAKAAQNK